MRARYTLGNNETEAERKAREQVEAFERYKQAQGR